VSQIVRAVSAGMINVLPHLADGCEVPVCQIRNPAGVPLLTLAVRGSHAACVEWLLGVDCRCDPLAGAPSGNTPLHAAAHAGDVAILEMMLDSAAMGSAGRRLVRDKESGRQGDKDDDDDRTDSDAETNAATRGPDGSVSDGARCFCDPANCNGDTPLMFAAMRGAADCVAALLARGCDARRANSAGLTALMAAASQGHTTVVAALLSSLASGNLASGAAAECKSGAIASDVDASDARGRTALHYAVAHVASAGGEAAAGAAQQRRQMELATVEIADQLLGHGADPFALSNAGVTPRGEAETLCGDAAESSAVVARLSRAEKAHGGGARALQALLAAEERDERKNNKGRVNKSKSKDKGKGKAGAKSKQGKNARNGDDGKLDGNSGGGSGGGCDDDDDDDDDDPKDSDATAGEHDLAKPGGGGDRGAAVPGVGDASRDTDDDAQTETLWHTVGVSRSGGGGGGDGSGGPGSRARGKWQVPLDYSTGGKATTPLGGNGTGAHGPDSASLAPVSESIGNSLDGDGDGAQARLETMIDALRAAWPRSGPLEIEPDHICGLELGTLSMAQLEELQRIHLTSVERIVQIRIDLAGLIERERGKNVTIRRLEREGRLKK
jgi:hypothetical protein